MSTSMYSMKSRYRSVKIYLDFEVNLNAPEDVRRLGALSNESRQALDPCVPHHPDRAILLTLFGKLERNSMDSTSHIVLRNGALYYFLLNLKERNLLSPFRDHH